MELGVGRAEGYTSEPANQTNQTSVTDDILEAIYERVKGRRTNVNDKVHKQYITQVLEGLNKGMFFNFNAKALLNEAVPYRPDPNAGHPAAVEPSDFLYALLSSRLKVQDVEDKVMMKDAGGTHYILDTAGVTIKTASKVVDNKVVGSEPLKMNDVYTALLIGMNDASMMPPNMMKISGTPVQKLMFERGIREFNQMLPADYRIIVANPQEKIRGYDKLKEEVDNAPGNFQQLRAQVEAVLSPTHQYREYPKPAEKNDQKAAATETKPEDTKAEDAAKEDQTVKAKDVPDDSNPGSGGQTPADGQGPSLTPEAAPSGLDSKPSPDVTAQETSDKPDVQPTAQDPKAKQQNTADAAKKVEDPKMDAMSAEIQALTKQVAALQQTLEQALAAMKAAEEARLDEASQAALEAQLDNFDFETDQPKDKNVSAATEEEPVPELKPEQMAVGALQNDMRFNVLKQLVLTDKTDTILNRPSANLGSLYRAIGGDASISDEDITQSFVNLGIIELREKKSKGRGTHSIVENVIKPEKLIAPLKLTKALQDQVFDGLKEILIADKGNTIIGKRVENLAGLYRALGGDPALTDQEIIQRFKDEGMIATKTKTLKSGQAEYIEKITRFEPSSNLYNLSVKVFVEKADRIIGTKHAKYDDFEKKIEERLRKELRGDLTEKQLMDLARKTSRDVWTNLKKAGVIQTTGTKGNEEVVAVAKGLSTLKNFRQTFNTAAAQEDPSKIPSNDHTVKAEVPQAAATNLADVVIAKPAVTAKAAETKPVLKKPVPVKPAIVADDHDDEDDAPAAQTGKLHPSMLGTSPAQHGLHAFSVSGQVLQTLEPSVNVIVAELLDRAAQKPALVADQSLNETVPSEEEITKALEQTLLLEDLIPEEDAIQIEQPPAVAAKKIPTSESSLSMPHIITRSAFNSMDGTREMSAAMYETAGPSVLASPAVDTSFEAESERALNEDLSNADIKAEQIVHEEAADELQFEVVLNRLDDDIRNEMLAFEQELRDAEQKQAPVEIKQPPRQLNEQGLKLADALRAAAIDRNRNIGNTHVQKIEAAVAQVAAIAENKTVEIQVTSSPVAKGVDHIEEILASTVPSAGKAWKASVNKEPPVLRIGTPQSRAPGEKPVTTKKIDWDSKPGKPRHWLNRLADESPLLQKFGL